MKRWTSIGFVILLCLQVGGCYLYIIGRLAAIRIEMRAQLKHLPEAQLTRFQFSISEFQKAKVDDHEIKVDSRMYDIARVSKQGNSILVLALHDEAEDNLLSFLNELVKRSGNDKKPIPAQLISLLSLEFLIEKNMLPANNCRLVTHQSVYQRTFGSVSFKITTPPPRS